jgi:hypothetical protein
MTALGKPRCPALRRDGREDDAMWLGAERRLSGVESGTMDVSFWPLVDPLRKFNINHEHWPRVFSIVWLRLAAWDY